MAQSRRGCTNSTERFSTARAELSLKTDPAVSPTAALCRLSAGGADPFLVIGDAAWGVSFVALRRWPESSFGEATDLFSVLLALTVKITEQRRQTPKVANTVLEACSSASVGFGASTQRKFPTPDGRFRHWETFCEAGAGDTAVDLYRRSRVEQKPSVVARKP